MVSHTPLPVTYPISSAMASDGVEVFRRGRAHAESTVLSAFLVATVPIVAAGSLHLIERVSGIAVPLCGAMPLVCRTCLFMGHS